MKKLGIKGGEGRTGREVYQTAGEMELIVVIGMIVIIALGIMGAMG